jgi:hypothetical protein
MTKYLIAALVSVTLIVAGCQQEPVQPAADDAAAAALRQMEAELNAAALDTTFYNRNFITHMRGRDEVPARNTHGQGVAKFQVSKDGKSIDYKLIVANISNVVGAHIHRGQAGTNGPVVYGLYSAAPGGGRINGPIAEGSFTPADLIGPYAGSTDFSLFLADLHADSLYVNVHTDDGVDPPNTGRGDFQDGEIRGQLQGHEVQVVN